MNMNKKAALLTVILLSPVCMYGMESSSSLGTRLFDIVTLKNVEDPKVGAYKKIVQDSLILQDKLNKTNMRKSNDSLSETFIHEEITPSVKKNSVVESRLNIFKKECNSSNSERLKILEEKYNPINRQRFWYATMMTGVSAGTGLAAWYLAPKDPAARKAVIGSAAVAGSSLLAACVFRYKAGKDADLAIEAANSVHDEGL